MLALVLLISFLFKPQVLTRDMTNGDAGNSPMVKGLAKACFGITVPHRAALTFGMSQYTP